MIIVLMFDVNYAEDSNEIVKAQVLNVNIKQQGDIKMKIVRLRILEGKFSGQEVTCEYLPIRYLGNNYELEKGKKVIIGTDLDANGKVNVSIIDMYRVEYIKMLSIIFLICFV
ncbi:hypothetical protein [Caminicella sporogenes]|uniref:hypothetical protein n=1 Tax=Caminicella sporogenes TaxID=166485 RepID=UPI001160AE8A|nr:hypothetical protein [Caminicella sporogenes]